MNAYKSTFQTNDEEKMLQLAVFLKAQENQENYVRAKPTITVIPEESNPDLYQGILISTAGLLGGYSEMQSCPYTNGSSRCSEFDNCSECLVNYVNTKENWVSFLNFANSFYGKEHEEQQSVEQPKPKMLLRE